MDMIYMDLTIAIGDSGLPFYGKFSASLVESNCLNHRDESALSSLTGYGETPLEAAANLLALANCMRSKQQEDT